MYGQYNMPMQGFQNPYLDRLQQMQAPQQSQMQRYEITRVNGKNGAEAFQMPPNSAILLLDETQPVVWLKTTDGAGYPTATPYSIAPYQTQPEPDFNSLNERITRLEAAFNEQSHASEVKQPAKRSKSADAE